MLVITTGANYVLPTNGLARIGNARFSAPAALIVNAISSRTIHPETDLGECPIPGPVSSNNLLRNYRGMP